MDQQPIQSCQPASRFLYVVARVMFVLLLLLVLPLAAARSQSASGDHPAVCRIGVNIENLYDFDLGRETFDAVLWLWSLCPSSEFSPLATITLPTATGLDMGELRSIDAGEHGAYQYRRIQGTFRHDWDMRHYPFDRHEIVIPFDETEHGAAIVVFEPDTDASFLTPDIRDDLEEWEVSDLTLETSISVEASSYGIPGAHGSRYSRLEAKVGLARRQLLAFFKLTAGVFAAGLISLLTFFYDSRDPRAIQGKLGLLIGALFAVLVNLRMADTTIGDASRMTLVTELHLVTLVLIVSLALFALREGQRAEKELPVTHPNWAMFGTMAALYLVVNAALVTWAAWG